MVAFSMIVALFDLWAYQTNHAYSVAKIRRKIGGNMAAIRRKLAGMVQQCGGILAVSLCHQSAGAHYHGNGREGCLPAFGISGQCPILPRLC